MYHEFFSLSLSFLNCIMGILTYTCLAGIFGLLNAIDYVEYLAQCLAHNKCLINISIIIIANNMKN